MRQHDPDIFSAAGARRRVSTRLHGGGEAGHGLAANAITRGRRRDRPGGGAGHVLHGEVAQQHELEAAGDDGLLEPGQQYLFGGPDELRPTASSLKGRVLARMRELVLTSLP